MGSRSPPIKTSAETQGECAKPDGFNPATERDVVVTATLKIEAALGLTDTVPGAEQIAPMGAPPQLNEAVPPVPAPPIESV